MAANDDTWILPVTEMEAELAVYPILIGQPARPLAKEESISGWIADGLAYLGRGIRRIVRWIRR